MNGPLQKIKEKAKTELKYKPIGYSRVLTNRMTITGWRLFKQNHRLHLAFIIYRLKIDFGFQDWEIANFTGMPKADIKRFMSKIRPLLESEVLKQMAELEYTYDKKEHEWRSLNDGRGRPQGYYVIKDLPAWYNKWDDPGIVFGNNSEEKINEKTNG